MELNILTENFGTLVALIGGITSYIETRNKDYLKFITILIIGYSIFLNLLRLIEQNRYLIM